MATIGIFVSSSEQDCIRYRYGWSACRWLAVTEPAASGRLNVQVYKNQVSGIAY